MCRHLRVGLVEVSAGSDSTASRLFRRRSQHCCNRIDVEKKLSTLQTMLSVLEAVQSGKPLLIIAEVSSISRPRPRAVSTAVRRVRAGLQDLKPPIGSFCERQHRKTRELTRHSRKAGQGRRDSS